MNSSSEPSSMLFGALVNRPEPSSGGSNDLDSRAGGPLRSAVVTILSVALLFLLVAAVAH